MPERIVTLTVEFDLAVADEQAAREVVAQWTTGMPRLKHTRMTDARESSVGTWDDDGKPLSEQDLMRAYGVDETVRKRRVPHALKRDLGVER